MKRTTKSLLAIVMTAVLVFGMAVPGFAVYSYGDGGSDNGAYADGATEQPAISSGLPPSETQAVNPVTISTLPLAEITLFSSDNTTIDLTGFDFTQNVTASTFTNWSYIAITRSFNIVNPVSIIGTASGLSDGIEFFFGSSNVMWNANVSGTLSAGNDMIRLTGSSGVFTVAGGNINVTGGGTAIFANLDRIDIIGGYISSTDGANTIWLQGSQINVSGGTISASAGGNAIAGEFSPTPNITGGTLIVGGNVVGGTISTASIVVPGSPFIYNGLSHNPTPTVTVGGTILTPPTQFAYVSSNNTNAGTANVTITGAGQFVDTATGTFTINRATGATVQTAPTMASTTHNTIAVNAAVLNSVPSSQQTIEYAISNSGTTAPTTGWGSNLTFTGLTPSTQYFVWARSAQNQNRNTGTAVASAGITTDTAPATDHAITVNGGIANHATAPQGQTVTITANAPSAGQQFVDWTSTSTGVTIANPTQANGATLMISLISLNMVSWFWVF